MPVVINELEVITDVVSRPAAEDGSDQPASRGQQKTSDFDELRRRLERAFWQAGRLAAD